MEYINEFGLTWGRVKKDSKKGLNLIMSYENSDMYSLEDAYKTPSYYKKRAYREWEEFVEKVGGSGSKICSANCQSFSYGFMCNNTLFYVTKDYGYIVC